MKNIFKDKAIFIYLFILIHPFLDLITSLVTRYELLNFSIGVIVKGIIILLFLIYIVFKSKSKYKKYLFGYCGLVGSFSILYFLTKSQIFETRFLIDEIIYLFKFFYLPLIFLILLVLCKQFKVDKDKLVKCLQINAIMFGLLIIIPELTGTGFSSYNGGANKGTIGWYYAANEIGCIFIILYCYICKLTTSSNKFWFLLVFPVVFGASIIGTKTSFLGLILISTMFIIYFIITIKKNKKALFRMIIIVLSIVVLSPNIPAVQNLKTNISEALFNNKNQITEREKQRIKREEVSALVLSSRNDFLKDTYKIYKDSNFDDKLFGIGFTNRDEIDDKRIVKLIEMDAFDILLRYGIIGFIIYIIPFGYLVYKSIRNWIKNKFKFDFEFYIQILAIFIALAISTMAGHVLGAPSVSIYIACSMILLYDYLREKKEVV